MLMSDDFFNLIIKDPQIFWPKFPHSLNTPLSIIIIKCFISLKIGRVCFFTGKKVLGLFSNHLVFKVFSKSRIIIASIFIFFIISLNTIIMVAMIDYRFELTYTSAHVCSQMGSWVKAPTHISTICILTHFSTHMCSL